MFDFVLFCKESFLTPFAFGLVNKLYRSLGHVNKARWPEPSPNHKSTSNYATAHPPSFCPSSAAPGPAPDPEAEAEAPAVDALGEVGGEETEAGLRPPPLFPSILYFWRSSSFRASRSDLLGDVVESRGAR